jgi:hypothetical protein
VSAGAVSRSMTATIRQGVSTFLAIAGLISLAVGLLYLLAGQAVPHFLQGQAHGGHHVRRAAACLIAGGTCVAVAWLLRGRRRAA